MVGDFLHQFSFRRHFRTGCAGHAYRLFGGSLIFAFRTAVSPNPVAPAISKTDVPDGEDAFIAGDERDRKRSFRTRRPRQEDCRRKTRLCGAALEWVRQHGKFAPAGSGPGFGGALSTGGGGTLAGAFRLEKLLGLLAQESSFGTNFGNSGRYKGPFQLSEEVVDDYNRHNDPDVDWPDDVDGNDDFETAARVAAWYLAFILQQLTWKGRRFTDPEEANKFALAAYNGGLGTIDDARDRAREAGKDPNKWDDVKDFLPNGTDEERRKKQEIIDYVRRIRGYERLARELGCVPQ